MEFHGQMCESRGHFCKPSFFHDYNRAPSCLSIQLTLHHCKRFLYLPVQCRNYTTFIDLSICPTDLNRRLVASLMFVLITNHDHISVGQPFFTFTYFIKKLGENDYMEFIPYRDFQHSRVHSCGHLTTDFIILGTVGKRNLVRDLLQKNTRLGLYINL